MFRFFLVMLTATLVPSTLIAATSHSAGEAAQARQAPQAVEIALQSRDGRNRRVRIHNQTGWTMVSFRAAEAGSRAWQDDALAGQALATGASRVATIDAGSGACVYGFRAEFSNGQTLERDAINVCGIADYYFTR